MTWDLDMFTYYQENLQEYQLEIDKLNKELENIKDKKYNSIECSICLDSNPNILYFPCKHITNCAICTKNVNKCPLCLVLIEKKIEIFYG